MLPDERVVEFWDKEFVVGTWFGRHLDDMGADEQTGGVYWDAFLVFDEDAGWGAVPSPLIDAGSTVIGQSGELQEALAPAPFNGIMLRYSTQFASEFGGHFVSPIFGEVGKP